MFYQFLIYDNELRIDGSSYYVDGVIIEVSQLYATKEECETAAIETCDEYAEEFDNDERFQYTIQMVEVVK